MHRSKLDKLHLLDGSHGLNDLVAEEELHDQLISHDVYT